MAKRKKWITPQLVVLVRGRPEEGVLQACKSDNVLEIVGPGSLFAACYTKTICTSNQCSVVAAS